MMKLKRQTTSPLYVGATLLFHLLLTGSALTPVSGQAVLRINAATPPQGNVGGTYAFLVGATGGRTPYLWSLASGSQLPPGTYFSQTDGGIRGTLTAAGSFNSTLQLTDSSTPPVTVSQPITIIVTGGSPLTISSTTLPNGRLSQAYTNTLVAAGGAAPYAWSISAGALPVGITLNGVTGLLSGTPTAAQTANFTARVQDGAGASVTRAFSIQILTAVSINSSSPPAAQVGTNYAFVAGAVGGRVPYSWSLQSGQVPPGTSLSAADGGLYGTPTTAGSFTFALRVADAAIPQNTGTATFTVTVNAASTPLSITTSSLPAGQTGTVYSAAISASGGRAPYTWRVASGALPGGLVLSATGTLSGTPTAAGSFTFTAEARDVSTPVQTVTRVLNIPVSAAPALTISSNTLPGGQVGSPYTAQLTASGGTAPYAWRILSGALPAGLALNASTGALSGTPSTAGAYTYVVEARDSSVPQRTGTRSVSTTVTDAGPAVLSLQFPSPNTTVRGNVTLSVLPSFPVETASVEYILNGRTFSGRVMVQPYSFAWNSASVWDGSHTLRAVARNDAGEVLATSSVVPFTIQNGTVTLSVVSPAAGATLSGTFNWHLTTNLPLTYSYAIFHCLIDGKQTRLHFTPERFYTHSVDSTTLANGTHELFCSLDGEGGPTGRAVGLAQSQLSIQVNNGSVVSELRSNFRTLHLIPGQTAQLQAVLAYTDGQIANGSATFASSNAAVATVDGSGVVRAAGIGEANITLTSGNRQSTVTVLVRSGLFTPHFSKSGELLTNYDPARSLFIRNIIYMDDMEMARQPGLAERSQEAAVNTLYSQIYINPKSMINPTYATWQREIDLRYGNLLTIANRYNFYLYMIGDDIARKTEELHDSLTNPWATTAIQYVIAKSRDARRTIALDMVDEVDFLWGSTPTPTDNRWLSRSPSVPQDAFTRVMNTIKSVPGRPMIAWPVSGAAPRETSWAWQSNPTLSDFTSTFWHYTIWRKAYPNSPTLGQAWFDMNRTILERRPGLIRDRPNIILAQISGPEFIKRDSNRDFTAGVDTLISAGHTAYQVSSQVFMAVVLGAAGIREYTFDRSDMKQIRTTTPANVGQHQTGSDPFEVGTDRWLAMSAAFNLTKRLEPCLLSAPMHALDLGAALATTARTGTNCRLLVAVNVTEAQVSARADMSTYRYNDGSRITRFRLLGGSLKTERIATTALDTVAFAPGETIVWLFQPAAVDGVSAPAVKVVSPEDLSVVSGLVDVTTEVANGTIDRVELYQDGTLLQTLRSAPFVFQWNTAPLSKGVYHGLTVRTWSPGGSYNEARSSVFVR